MYDMTCCQVNKLLSVENEESAEYVINSCQSDTASFIRNIQTFIQLSKWPDVFFLYILQYVYEGILKTRHHDDPKQILEMTVRGADRVRSRFRLDNHSSQDHTASTRSQKKSFFIFLIHDFFLFFFLFNGSHGLY